MSQLPRELIMSKITIPAVPCKQNGKTCYQVVVTFDQVSKIFTDVDESLPASERHQRKINKTRVASITGYLVDNFEDGTYIIPPLVASISHNNLTFKDGKLTFESDSIILINDGQHRQKGIIEALSEIGERSPRIKQEEVGVMLIPGISLQSAQQICSDINKNAKNISPSLAQVYDDRDEDIKTTKAIRAKVPLFLNFIDEEKGQPAKDNLFTFAQLNKSIFLINETLFNIGVIREDQYPIITAYWNTLSELIKEWNYVCDGIKNAKNSKIGKDHLTKKIAEFKVETLAFHGGTLWVLGELGSELIEKRGKVLIETEGEKVDWYNFFHKELCLLEEFNFSKDNPQLQPIISESLKGKKTLINGQNSKKTLLEWLKQEIGLAPKQTELLKP